MSSSSASSSPFALPSPDHHHHHLSSSSSSDQLCYVRCEFCETVLAVCVPCTSLFKTVTVRCGHCTNLLSVNMRALLLPPPPTSHLQLAGHSFFGGPPPPPGGQNNLLLEEMRNSSSPSNNLLMHSAAESFLPVRDIDDLPKTPAVKRPPEKRQRVPSAYNRFIKDEIQRIKTGNPDISHREAFSAAAKNWAHFPHIHFGLMPDQPVKKPNVLYQQQEGDDHLMMKDGFLGAAAANVGLSPY